MSNKDGRNGPAHMAPSRRGASKNRQASRRKEPLRDNYYYEEPPREGFEDVASYSSPKRRKDDQRELERQKGKKGMGKGKKAVLITVGVVVVLVAAGLWYVFGYLLKDLTIEPITKDPVKLGWEPASGASAQDDFQVVLDDSVKNIAMFGVDDRGGTFEGRSDVIMILTVDNKHGKIKMTSIARDTCVNIADYGDDKLTHAYFYGGPELAINTLNRNFHLRMEDFVTVNFAKMAEIIDACGGVELELTAAEVQQINVNLWSLLVDVEEQIEDDKYSGDYKSRDDYAKITREDMMPNIYGELNVDSDVEDYEDGTYLLNGNQAVAYGRIRYLEGGDDVRMERQQNVLKALINRVRGKSKLEYPEMIRKIMPMCKTSLDFEDIMGMLPIMFTNFTIETMTLPSEVENPNGGYIRSDCWVYLYDLEAASKHISQFVYESDSPYYGQEIIGGDHGFATVDAGDSDSTDYNDGAGMLSSAASSSPSSEVESDPSSGSSSEVGVDPSSGMESGGGEESSFVEDPGSGGETGGEGEDPGYDPGYDPGEEGGDAGYMDDPAAGTGGEIEPMPENEGEGGGDVPLSE